MKGLGIPNGDIWYFKCEKDSILREKIITNSMTKSIAKWFAQKHFLPTKNIKVQFINYGDTELVYVVSYGQERYTLVIGQPNVALGVVKKEAELLAKYSRLSPKSVVAPLEYYKCSQGHHFNKDTKDFRTFHKEAYITPYIMQARCIASQENGFGVYVPEPDYHFERFSKEESEVVCASMIAKLVALYDEERGCGISACKLGGGDFMLDKEWNRKKLSPSDTLAHMKLIAARDEIKCPLEEYIALIRNEFSCRTYYSTEAERDKSVLLNHKARVGMTDTAIENGIEAGKMLRSFAKDKQKTGAQQSKAIDNAIGGKSGK